MIRRIDKWGFARKKRIGILIVVIVAVTIAIALLKHFI